MTLNAPDMFRLKGRYRGAHGSRCLAGTSDQFAAVPQIVRPPKGKQTPLRTSRNRHD
jgi:hypothetical protein